VSGGDLRCHTGHGAVRQGRVGLQDGDLRHTCIAQPLDPPAVVAREELRQDAPVLGVDRLGRDTVAVQAAEDGAVAPGDSSQVVCLG
jgi:hypothetical protein